jgi:hypothetical protein
LFRRKNENSRLEIDKINVENLLLQLAGWQAATSLMKIEKLTLKHS